MSALFYKALVHPGGGKPKEMVSINPASVATVEAEGPGICHVTMHDGRKFLVDDSQERVVHSLEWHYETAKRDQSRN